MKTLSYFCAVICAILLMGCSSVVQLTSDWKTAEITIDGNHNDWETSLYNLEKTNINIGVLNDTENLYICLISYDRNVRRQILDGGFTVWFDPAGGTDEKYGIKFPVGRPRKNRTMNVDYDNRPPQMPGRNDTEVDDIMPPPMPDNMDSLSWRSDFGDKQNKMLSMFNEIQFLGPEEKDVQLATILELKTIKVHIGMTDRAFVYELKVPLHRTDDFPFTIVPTNRKNIISVEFKTENISMSRMGMPAGGPGGRGPGGGGPPQGDRPSAEGPRVGYGGPGGRSAERDSNSSEPLELWVQITLASIVTSVQ